MKLLLSIDNSEHSQLAIEDVSHGLWPDGTEVMIATAVWSPFGFVSAKDSSSEAAQKLLKSAAETVGQNQYVSNVETKVLEGNPKTEIINLLAANKFDLLVMGSRRPSMQKLLFGSVSHALLLGSPCSVRIARRSIVRKQRRVLVGFDGSEFCWRALSIVAGRHVPEGTEIFIVNAVPTVDESAWDNPHVFSQEQLEQGRSRLMEIAQDGLVQAKAKLSADLPHCVITTKILNGHPRKALIAACEDYDADIIFVGTQGRNFSALIAIGSVSEAVAVGAPCTVEIIKSTNA
ncbi:MAG TPA: universal stress protein [Drouetiella sp.]|jgi:nucleotide-binding universal stress UspA family protein